MDAEKRQNPGQSPGFVRCSMAAAMTLGLKPGRFWRNARLHCINLLLTYENGCKGVCAYCGLSRMRNLEGGQRQEACAVSSAGVLQVEKNNTLKRELQTESRTISSECDLQVGKNSTLKRELRTKNRTFIRVQWPIYPLREIISRLARCRHARRVCISMITHPRALDDTAAIVQAIRLESPILISALITPTLVDAGEFERLKACGVDKIGIAIDAATPQPFDRLRGASAGGPHRWQTYWERVAEAAEVFGRGNVGVHFIVGLGESERDMAGAFQTVHDLGGTNQLFSFYPEPGSRMEDVAPPPMDSYRRVQLAAHLIDAGICLVDDFIFDPVNGRIVSFGIAESVLDGIIESGEPFMTRGCVGPDGRVACNRPFANSPPGPGLRNYPFSPDHDDIERIRHQLAGQWREEEPIRSRRRPSGASGAMRKSDPNRNGRDGSAARLSSPKSELAEVGARPSTSGAIADLSIRRAAITFFAPSFKHYDTDDFRSSGQPIHIAASVTGTQCDLRCLHCGGQLLRNTYSTPTPAELWDLTLRLKSRGLRGLLLTGGCGRDGVVPLGPFCPTLARLKSELGLHTTVHSKLMNRSLAGALRGSDIDAALLDVVGSLDMLKRVYRLADKTLDDIGRSLDLLAEYAVPVSPHVILSNLAGADGEGDRALALLEGRQLRSLVIVLLMPLAGCDVGPTADWDLAEVGRLFNKARATFPTTPLLLGCARPAGQLQKEIDALAVEAGFDGIAFPSEAAVARAKQSGHEICFSEMCCS
ncbi:radical SAM protein, partial [Candidatus Sumerlaeota bacterium]|nr:radical SAM protein [Candidatus Sumerlaeota bacterium]